MPSSLGRVRPGTVSPRRPVPRRSSGRSTSTGPAPRRTPGPRSRTPRRSSGCGSPAGSPRRRMAAAAARHRPGRHHRRARPGRPRVPARPRRLPLDAGLQGLPQVAVHVSVNEVICHGIPDDRLLEDGDIVNIDITAYIGGRARRHQRDLPGRRRRRGVAAAGRAHPRGDDARASRRSCPGAQINVIGRVIESLRASGSATAWCATSPGTASARRSTPGWSSRTTTRRRRTTP